MKINFVILLFIASIQGGCAGPTGSTKPAEHGENQVLSRPIYPSETIRARKQADVLLRVLVGESGYPKKVEILKSSGFANLDEAAVKTVRSWKFIPAKRDGKLIEGFIDVPVKFLKD